jgi:hypothetical protein
VLKGEIARHPNGTPLFGSWLTPKLLAWLEVMGIDNLTVLPHYRNNYNHKKIDKCSNNSDHFVIVELSTFEG